MAQFIRRTPKELLRHHNTLWRPPICIYELRRSFTASSQKNAVKGMRRRQEAMARATSGRPAQAHPKIQAKAAAATMTADKIPDDVGLVQGTFVMPTGARRPSILDNPLLLGRLYWMQAKTKAQDFAGRVVYHWFFWRSVPSDKKPPRPPIQRRTIVPKAKELHKKVYTALARGDEDTLKEIACKNLLAEYKIRIARRRPGETVHWKLVKYVGITPRIISHKCGAMGMDFGGLALGIQQVVVKIRSVQMIKTLMGDRRVDGLGRPVAKTGAPTEKESDIDWKGAMEKTVTEYIVLQRRLLKGVPEDWRVWGFAKEFDVADLKKEDGVFLDEAAAMVQDKDAEKQEDGTAKKQKNIASAYS